MRLALIANNASLRKGGESARPLHYLRGLRDRGHDATLYTHQRVRDELQQDLPDLIEHIRFVPDTAIQRWVWFFGKWLPERAREFSVGQLVTLCTQRQIMNLIRSLPKDEQPELVHQITPISPKSPSVVRHTCPVVIGPLNGDIDYPRAFKSREPLIDRVLVPLGRPLATFINRIFSGKRHADIVLVSNVRTHNALPVDPKGEVELLTANAVEMSQWTETVKHGPRERVRFVFLGRLVRFKAVDLLLEAFAASEELRSRAELVIIGSGPQLPHLRRQARDLGIREQTLFPGWVTHDEAIKEMQQCDAFVFPSLQDPGGAVVMEACAMGLPVICADWAGPADYLPQGAGLMIDVSSREKFLQTLTQHMLDLASSPERRALLGRAARQAAEAEFDWIHRVEAVEQTYKSLLGHPEQASPGKNGPALAAG